LPISEKYSDYAHKVLQSMNERDIRGFVDDRDEKIGKKIRDSEVKKIPFMLVVGEKEQSEDTVSVRKHGEGDLGSYTLDGFASFFNEKSRII